ncbi:trypsin-like peptidase domain-containing protein [Mycetocola sp.]|uniref:trypsin-like peptidase domain-containing protein n=1 Tax=Mycetocola sp. TaxID=1871042 RepID=UPI003988E8D4
MNEHPQDSNDARDPHDAAGTHPDPDAASSSWHTPAPNENIPPAPTYFPEYAPPQHADTAATDAYPQAPGAAFGVGAHPTDRPTEAYPAFAGTHQQFAGHHNPENAQNTHPYASSFGTPSHSAAGGAGPAGKGKRRSTVGLLIAGLAIGALVGGATGAGTAALLMENDGTTLSTGATGPQNITINDTSDVTRATAIAATASPSVVTLAVQSSDSGGSGSGIVLSKDGYVLTNNHVVTLDGQLSDAQIQVTDNSGKLYSATVVGTDPIYDLAVIKLDGASGMTPMAFADSDKLNVGDVAVAIGAPLGLAGTVTDGIVSALNRSITVASSAVPDDTTEEEDGSEDPFFNFPGQDQAQAQSSISLSVIQTDAAINPGNSGGALVDSDGKLIGVNVAIASAGSSQAGDQSGNIGVGFAITANIAKRVADEIIETGKATHGLLGASVGDAAKSADSPVVGALISNVSSGGAAADAGLAAGDIITSFDGKPITNATDLTAQVRGLAAGATAEVIYVRGDETKTVEVTLGELVL